MSLTVNWQTKKVGRQTILATKVGFSLLILAIASSNVQANTLLYNTKYLEYEPPKTVTKQCFENNNCPEIEVTYLNSNQPWINTIINRHIDEMTINNASMFMEETNTEKKKKLSVKQALDAFTRSQIADIPVDSSLSFSLEMTPKYNGHINDFELFTVNGYVYTGGAHGMPYRQHFIFDTKAKKHIQLNDIILANQQKRFNALAYNAYKKWVVNEAETKDIKSYEASWPFSLSDNFTFTDKGIELLYQPYEMAAYVYGMPTLTIEYAQLQGIIDPHILARLPKHK